MGLGMSVADAAYHTVHDYPGGAAALQVRMGKTNLSGEVNPNIKTAKLGIEDAVTVQALAGDFRVLYAMAVELGHFPPVPMPDGVSISDAPCMQTLSEAAKEFSDVVSTVAAGLADGKVSDNDLASATREWSELIVKGQLLMQQLAAMNVRLKAGGA